MLKLSETEVGKIYTLPLVVMSITARETKAKKPYLSMELYDGVDKIQGNFWDWGGKNIPDKNSILDVTAQVTEWQGNKQLSIKSLATNSERHISEFTPSSGIDIATVYKAAYVLATEIPDDFFRMLCLAALEELQSAWISAPGAKTIHHAYTAGTLIHSFSVAKLAKVMAQLIPGADESIATAGGLLHDIGKLFGYKIDGVVCEMTEEGILYDHLFIGAEFIGNFANNICLINTELDERKLEILRHIILSHHGSREAGAVTLPACIEAHIVFHADSVDAAAEIIRDASSKVSKTKLTDRIWALGNQPQITTDYVAAIMQAGK